MKKQERIDKLLVELGFTESVIKSQALVMAGVILADEKRVDKSSERFGADVNIRIKGQTAASKYVGRGGLKMEKALNEFNICPNEYICLDVGSSTGGFTDCLLQYGAKRVYAIDVGTNQLDWKLRTDERVEVRENTNARSLTSDDFPVKFDLIVIDVSFISIKKILSPLLSLLKTNGKMIALIKPQFEVRKSEVGRGGIVVEKEKHDRVVKEVNQTAEKLGLHNLKMTESPILGAEGNKEFLALYEKF